MARTKRTVGLNAAASILGISNSLLVYRATKSHRIRVHRRSPLRFRLSDVLDARPAMKVRDRRGRPSTIDKIQEVFA